MGGWSISDLDDCPADYVGVIIEMMREANPDAEELQELG
jgi:hypothetical protein